MLLRAESRARLVFCFYVLEEVATAVDFSFGKQLASLDPPLPTHGWILPISAKAVARSVVS